MKTQFNILTSVLLMLLVCHGNTQAAPNSDNAVNPATVTEHPRTINQYPVRNELPVSFSSSISLKGEEYPLRSVLRSISLSAGYNIIYGPEVEADQVISVDFKNLELWRALNTVLYPLSYGFKVTGNDLVILAAETRIFTVNLPPITQNFSDLTSNESFVSSSDNGSDESSESSSSSSQEVKVGTKIIVENHLSGLSLWDDILLNLKELVSPAGSYNANRAAGIVTVTDSPRNLDSIEAYFNEINNKFSSQIEASVKVVEVTFTDESKWGVDWNALADNLSMATNFSTSNFTSGNLFTFTAKGPDSTSGTDSSGVSAVITALNTYGNVEIISQPRVVLLNNIPAVMQVGATQAYIDSSQIETTQVGSTTTLSTSQVHSGVTLRLMASIIGENIYLSVTPNITTVDSIRSISAGSTTIEAPQTTTKTINTTRMPPAVSITKAGYIKAPFTRSLRRAFFSIRSASRTRISSKRPPTSPARTMFM